MPVAQGPTVPSGPTRTGQTPPPAAHPNPHRFVKAGCGPAPLTSLSSVPCTEPYKREGEPVGSPADVFGNPRGATRHTLAGRVLPHSWALEAPSVPGGLVGTAVRTVRPVRRRGRASRGGHEPRHDASGGLLRPPACRALPDALRHLVEPLERRILFRRGAPSHTRLSVRRRSDTGRGARPHDSRTIRDDRFERSRGYALPRGRLMGRSAGRRSERRPRRPASRTLREGSFDLGWRASSTRSRRSRSRTSTSGRRRCRSGPCDAPGCTFSRGASIRETLGSPGSRW